MFVEVPQKGKQVEQNGQAAVVESTKAASDVFSPISGEVKPLYTSRVTGLYSGVEASVLIDQAFC